MDLSKLDSLPTDQLIALRDSAERLAQKHATAGDLTMAAGAWFLFRVYGAGLASRGVAL